MKHSHIVEPFFLFVFLMFAFSLPAGAQPKSRRSDIKVEQVCVVGSNTVRVKRDPVSGRLYVVQNNGIIQRVNFAQNGTATLTTVYQKTDTHLNAPLGITFGADGTMYLTGNDSTGVIGSATVVKGVPTSPGSETRTWSMIAQTVGYRYGNIYNHRVNAVILNPTADSLIVNSGAATDHGEAHGGYREAGLTSTFWKLPITGDSIILHDDREWLRSNGYLFAEGNRNTFDLAYAGNGDLFGPENSDDRDDPEELNWIQEGHHYGFPWRIGGDNTPQQWTPYDPHKDPLLSTKAWGGGTLYTTYSEDSTYPQRPDSILFTEPIPSVGPDADHFRDTTTGAVKDASQLGVTLTTFTPHLSIDGIVFDKDSILQGDLRGNAFVISFSNSSLITDLGDTSQDLMMISLTKSGGNYTARVTKLVTGFNSPLGIEMVNDTLYVVETGLQNSNFSPKMWRIILPLESATGVAKSGEAPSSYALDQNFPNPFNPSTAIGYRLPATGYVTVKVFDELGREVATLVNSIQGAGAHTIRWNASGFASGVYIYEINAGNFRDVKKMVLMK
ncbi:MAG TPA: T9SS type A sorting domain-containing protein [Bacteroidota bacterium]|nr:T9SS type A sorting domain-containing protein [Bacteroidota bacterium]